jgi:hypothetical protein
MVSLVEQELLTLPEHLNSPPVFSGIHVSRSLVLFVCFVDCCLSFCPFSSGHCVVCSSLIYEFWLPLWYLQTLLMTLGENHTVTKSCKLLIFKYVITTVYVFDLVDGIRTQHLSLSLTSSSPDDSDTSLYKIQLP